LVIQGNVQKSLEIGQQLLARAHRSGDPVHLLQAHHALWPTHFFRGEVVASLESMEAGLALYDPIRHPSLASMFGGHDARICGLAFASMSRFVRGYPRQAAESARQVIELAEQLGHPHSLANGYSWVALALGLLGHFELALTTAEASQRVAAEYGFPQWGALGMIAHGFTLAALGQVEEGLIEMRRGLADWRATHARSLLPTFLALIAEAELRRGDVDAALRAVEEALAGGVARGERLSEAELYRLKGEALLARPSPDAPEAEACFQRALTIARAQEAKGWELRAALSLARLWRSRGRGQDARRLVAETAAWFTEGHDTTDLRAASELIGQLT
jgi:predicted ATPase